MAFKIDVSIVDLPSALTSARYLVLDSNNNVIEKGTVDVEASGACTIDLDDSSEIVENQNVLVMIDDFDGSNFSTTGRAMDWATVVELYKDFTVNQIGNYVQCDNRTGAYGDWDMGDGTILSEEDPLHLYLENGTYVITNDDFSASVQITGAVPFNVSVDKNIITCTPQSDIDGIWDFGNGESSSEGGIIEHEYFENGSYDVVYAEDSRFTQTIVMDYFTDMVESISGNIVTFFNPTGTSGMVFDYGDGFSGTELVHEYPQGGRFIAEINGMYGVVNVEDYAMPTVVLNYVKDDEVLGLVNFTPDGASTYTLYVDGAEYIFQDGESVEHDFRNSGAGIYSVVCVGIDEVGNSGTYEESITVLLENIAPTLEVSVTDVNLLDVTVLAIGQDSEGESLNYTWSMGDGTGLTGKSLTHSYPVSGTYTIECTVTDDRSPSMSTTKSVTVEVSDSIEVGGDNLLSVNNEYLSTCDSDPNGLMGGFYYSTFNFSDGIMEAVHNNQKSDGRVAIDISTLGLEVGSTYRFSVVARIAPDADLNISYLPCGTVVDTYLDGADLNSTDALYMLDDSEWHTYEVDFTCTDNTSEFRIYGSKNLEVDSLGFYEAS